ncbi:MAG: ATP-binding protein [Acidobacteria bacterium]|jgi:predicted AAA+ superfamily ATPase|nr:MAG: ATP-binding protein [Acidobacteriota bacterium]
MGIEVLAYRFKDGELQPIEHPHVPSYDSLLHIDRQKELLRRNTLQFVRGLPANDALLWGDRGTGKSSLVKSMLGLFAKEGLRLVQVYKMDIGHLSELYSLLRKREERFILFFDDLSFEPHEDRALVLKSLMDGDVEERPQNMLIYATSNRRHLMPLREESEKFPEESHIERVSLVERFGLRLGFFAFGKEQFLSIVRHMLNGRELQGIDLERLALDWALHHGFSGRSASQFVKDLMGRLRLGHEV